MSPTVLCSTGVLTREPDRSDHKQILEHGAKLGTTALELLLHEAWYGHLDEVVEDLKGSSFSFPVVHSDKGIGSGLGSDDGDEVEDAHQLLEVNCRAAAALGAKTLVLHLWELPTGDDEIERNLEQLPAMVERRDFTIPDDTRVAWMEIGEGVSELKELIMALPEGVKR